MDDYWPKAKLFVRVCFQIASHGRLKLQDLQLIHLYNEIRIMAEYLDDKETAMDVYNQLALLCKKHKRYEEAIKAYQMQIRFAEMTQNIHVQISTYWNLAYVYGLSNSHNKALECLERSQTLVADSGDKDEEALLEYHFGEFYRRTGQHQKAVECLEKMLTIAKETKNLFHERIAYINMASAHEALKDTKQAIDCYLKYLEISPQNDPRKCDVCLNLGIAYQSKYKWSEAFKYLDMGLEISRKIAYLEGEGRACECLGSYHNSQGYPQNALECFKKHLEVVNVLKNKRDQGRAHRNIATVLQTMGEHSMAIDHSQKGLDIAMELNDKDLEAYIFGTLGQIYSKQGNNLKAVEFFQRQFDICAKFTGSQRGQSRACSSLGIAYKDLGKYYEAISWHKKALDICSKVGPEKNIAIEQTNLGVVYGLLGQHHKAFEHFTECLEISRKIKDRYLEGKILGNLCSTSVTLCDYKKADAYSKDCLAIAQETKNQSSEARALGNCANSKLNLGMYDKALEFAEKQICLSEKIDDKESLYDGYSCKGVIYKCLNKYQQAEFYIQKALQICQMSGNKRGKAHQLTCLGSLFFDKACFHIRRGENEEYKDAITKAIKFLQDALHCWEWLFEHIQNQDHFKISILDRFIAEYNMLAIAFLLENKPKEALIASERGKARALCDVLALEYGMSNASSSQREPISYDEVQYLASRFSIIFYHVTSKEVFSWAINQEGCQSVQLLFKSSFFEIVNAAFSDLKVREAMSEERFIDTEEHSQRAVPLEASKMDVPEAIWASKYKRCVYDEDLYTDDIERPLEELHARLISPVLSKLSGDEIVIIPDGYVYMTPFAALRDPVTGTYLSETKAIRLAPSLTTMRTLQDCPAEFHNKSGALVIGNPQVGEVMFRGKKKDVSDLPGAELEAQKIGKLLGVQPILGSQATKEAIKHHLREGVAVIHFAAHGTRDGEIFLTPTTRNNQTNGFQAGEKLPTPLPTSSLPEETDYILTMEEIQESGVRPQLVVLSCCHSGRGDIKADGVIGMTRAFLAAGARAVVASLWAIADDATMVFMEKFYNHLKQRESASKSLQLAMRDMREIPEYKEPMFWAPFFLIGDDVRVEM